MDGNNRWSKINKTNKFLSYKNGSENLIKLTKYIFTNTKINYVSAFALSNSNLKRSNKIISFIKKILNDFLDREINDKKLNFAIIFIGDLSFLNKETNLKIKKIKNISSKYKNKLIIFLNYSGRIDILNSFNKLIPKKTKIKIDDIVLNLSTLGIPDPDILIRTGGFNRISDFMLYQLSFTELFFSKKLWPDYSIPDLKKVLNNFDKIERKFGL